jgi:MoaA/NifB/PqqE/SkfB family radical SAM enzyme
MCSVAEMRTKHAPEISVADIERVVRDCASFRPTFYLGGGEPFARSDLEDAIEVIKRAGSRVGTVTNALLVTPERGERVKRLGLDSIMISLHGDEEVHDRIVGVKGAFRRATANIEAFCRDKRGTHVLMNFVLSAANIDRAVDFVSIGKRLGVDQVRLEHLLFMTDAEMEAHEGWCRVHLPESMHESIRVSGFVCGAASIEGLSGRVQGVLREARRRHGDFVVFKPTLDDAEMARWYTEGYVAKRPCLFVWRSVFIDPWGNVIPCQHYAGMKFGNIRREPFMEIWDSPRYRQMRRVIRRGILPGCSRCCKL